MIDQRLGHFRIIEKIGAGGMGEVYRARDEQLERDVALKILPAASFRDPTARTRLLREARLASKLNHPHICTIHEVGEADGQAYIAMELVEGQPLSARLAEGPLRPDELLRYGLQLTDAVTHAHEHGVVHRDLKSANVVVTPDGRLKVLDFGLARQVSHDELVEATSMTQAPASLTAPGMLVGTLAYMAPEQLRGQAADTRSDVWALGVMLQEMATGDRPFQGNTPFELSSAILSQAAAPLPASVPLELQAVIEHCLRKEPGQRYRRASEVHAALEAVQSGTAMAQPETVGKGSIRRHWLAVAAIVVVLVAVAGGFLVGVLSRRLPGTPAALRQHALAVLPLTNLSGDPEQKYFVDGLTDTLIDDLARVGGALRVVSRSSTEGYATNPKPLAQVARELGVDAVVEGSVAREGNLVRVTAALIEPATEKRLWSERYERNLTSVLALQADIARAVAQAIKGTLSPEEENKLARTTREVNPKVFEAYTKGMFLLNQSTPDAVQKGMEYLHQAVELDPTDPLAYAGLSDGYITLAHGANPPQDAFIRAKAAARTAVELDGALPQAVFAMGAIKGYIEWDWPVGIATLRRTIDLNPSFAMAHYHLAWFLVLQGQMQEAIAEHIKAREADPLNPLMTAWLGELYRWNGQYDLAIAEVRKALELSPKFWPSYFVQGMTYADQGRWDQAIEAMRQAGEADPEAHWAVGAMYARAGRTAEARKMLAELNKEPASSWTALWRGCIYAALGEKDAAFKWLSYEPHHIWTPWLFSKEWQMFMKPLYGDPRFRGMQRKMNVPELRT
jgi:TolB-like protein/tRNA A-37 threonylcarbamoyl transferase component Bud32